MILISSEGFLSSYIQKNLILRGIDFRVLTRKKNLSPGERFIYIDEISRLENINTIINTATNYGRKGEAISEVVDSNVNYGIRLLDIAHQHSASFVNIGTILKNSSVYSLSKRFFSDILLSSQREKVINVNFDFIYGPGNSNEDFVTWVIKNAVAGDTIELSSCLQTRNLVHVDEIAKKVVELVINPPVDLRLVNMIGDDIRPLKDFVCEIQKILFSRHGVMLNAVFGPDNNEFCLVKDTTLKPTFSQEIKFDSGISSVLSKWIL